MHERGLPVYRPRLTVSIQCNDVLLFTATQSFHQEEGAQHAASCSIQGDEKEV